MVELSRYPCSCHFTQGETEAQRADDLLNAQSQRRPELESRQPSPSTGFSCPPHHSPDLSRLQEVKLACGGRLRSLQGWEEEPEVTSKEAKVTLDLVPLVIQERGRRVPLKGAVCMAEALH